jgi:hypothetical protein
MKDQAEFVPMAQRDLILVRPDGYQMPIHVAVGAPYAKATSEGMEDHAACLVLTCDEPDLATEVFGQDEMEALTAGLEFIETFLTNLTDDGGKLTSPDGAPFDPSGSILLKESRKLSARRAR